MIFVSFDLADISAFRNAKEPIFLLKNDLEKTEIIDTSEEAIRIRDIDCIKVIQFLLFS